MLLPAVVPHALLVCGRQPADWAYRLTQYDEFDNAALTMIAHSPTAWDHVHFKDVLVKVSNVEVYYKAISFYLAEHPDLLVDMLKVRRSSLTSPGPLAI